jgi:hypothetical protein
MPRHSAIKSFHAAASLAGAALPRPLGLREIPVSHITGSVGRWTELGADFLPRRGQHNRDGDQRRRRVEAAVRRGMILPAIEVYRVGDEYFVLDGHHRVAVAKATGQLYIDADVTDYLLTRGGASELGDRHAFEARTRLQRIELTDPSHYARLLSQVEEHCWALGQARQEAVDLPDAAADWREHVYEPVLGLIEREGIPERLPDRTFADLYAYVSDHKWYEGERRGYDVGFAWAAADFARYCPPRPRQHAGEAVWSVLRSAAALFVPDGLRPPYGV